MTERKNLTPFHVIEDGDMRTVWLPGRVAWAVEKLRDAGEFGCTPLDTPGPRWSAYVHKLRNDFGINVETIQERHKGPFPGRHARYVLRADVRPADREAA